MKYTATFIFVWVSGVALGFGLTIGIQPSPQLLVITDSGTGCQYVSYKRGGLYPRLDASGHQVCNSK